ncbi:TetR/AcrR family transcriptional regulator [Hydrogenophaga sp. RWCD_12]|uniref:TetR/AcrR family transcriptional regulator n=1 Tax=Hydrogenophaga sp. RWCD_12 TaxID=3391190 RepID=UPI00398509BF
MTAQRKTSKPLTRRSPRQVRARETVAVILEAAMLLLQRQGVAGLTTNRIAERAGVSIGSLYGYFPNKQSILIALARRLFQEDRKAVVDALQSAVEQGADPVRSIVRVLFLRHRHEAVLRRTLLSAYFGAGLSGDDAEQVSAQVATIASHPQGPMAVRSLTEAQLFVISRAVLGIARSLTESADEVSGVEQTLEDEAVRLVYAYLEVVAR